MTISSNDVTFTFSGGGSNSNPDLSLGGIPSVNPIINSRLFDDVSESERASGITDYRCIYFNNDSNTDIMYLTEISLSNLSDTTTIELGFDFKNERQVITISNGLNVTGGSFVLTYIDLNDNYNVTVNYNSSLSTWGSNLQTALRTVPYLDNVLVSSSSSGNNVIFEIDYAGKASNRYHEILLLDTNSLTGASTTIAITKSISGSPINQIVDEIDLETTPINRFDFSEDTVLIGDLRPLDSVPIWIKRTVPAGTEIVENDGFTLRVRGKPFSS